jgi:hypothetical protein
MKNALWLYASLLLLFVGCKKADDVKSITGVYNQEFKTTFFAATKHQINFSSGNHFQMKLQRISDIVDIDSNATCPSNRTDYVMGTYTVAGNELSFEGKYCDASYTQPKPMCDGTTEYVTEYKFKRNGSFLILDYNKDQPNQIWLKPD